MPEDKLNEFLYFFSAEGFIDRAIVSRVQAFILKPGFGDCGFGHFSPDGTKYAIGSDVKGGLYF